MSPISDELRPAEYPPLRSVVPLRAFPAEPGFLHDNLSTYRPHLSRGGNCARPLCACI